MGDQANIVVIDSRSPTDGAVYLFAQRGGEALPGVVEAALAPRWRWNDSFYLARILFDRLTEGLHGEERGFGISAVLTDNAHPLLVIDCGTETVNVVDEGQDVFAACGDGGLATRRVPFEGCTEAKLRAAGYE